MNIGSPVCIERLMSTWTWWDCEVSHVVLDFWRRGRKRRKPQPRWRWETRTLWGKMGQIQRKNFYYSLNSIPSAKPLEDSSGFPPLLSSGFCVEVTSFDALGVIFKSRQISELSCTTRIPSCKHWKCISLIDKGEGMTDEWMCRSREKFIFKN